VSNYAKAGCRSRHNQVYWQGRPYYAFGLGAASFLGGVRFSRPAKMPAYYEWVATSGPLRQAAALDEGVTSSAPSQTDEVPFMILCVLAFYHLMLFSHDASQYPRNCSSVHPRAPLGVKGFVLSVRILMVWSALPLTHASLSLPILRTHCWIPLCSV